MRQYLVLLSPFLLLLHCFSSGRGERIGKISIRLIHVFVFKLYIELCCEKGCPPDLQRDKCE